MIRHTSVSYSASLSGDVVIVETLYFKGHPRKFRIYKNIPTDLFWKDDPVDEKLKIKEARTLLNSLIAQSKMYKPSVVEVPVDVDLLPA